MLSTIILMIKYDDDVNNDYDGGVGYNNGDEVDSDDVFDKPFDDDGHVSVFILLWKGFTALY